MKIYNNIFQSNTLYKNNATTNLINFRANKFKTVMKSSHLIDNSLSASLDLPTQDIVESIYRNMKALKKLFKTNTQKAIDMRSKYPNILQKPILQGGYSFILTDGEDKGKTLSIVRSKNASDILRLVVTENGHENSSKHVLIKGLDKVVANINQKYPYVIPQKLRYMSAKEITDSNVVRYISIIEQNLDNYYRFLQGEKVVEKSLIKEKEEVVPEKPIQRKESVMRVTKSQTEMTDKIFEIFDNGVEKLPKHISPKISPNSGKVLLFTLATEDGGNLRVSKSMNPDYSDKLRYIWIAKTMPDGKIKYLAIDTTSKKFLKTDSKSGKPMIPDGEIIFYTTAEVERLNLKEFFEETYNQIFRDAKPAEIQQTQEIGVLKIKEPVKVIDLDETEPEPLDFEDQRLNKILDKTAMEAEKKDVITNEPEIKPRKKRGRKPKTTVISENKQTANQEINKKTTDINLDNIVDMDIIKEKIVKKAEKDAEILSELYINTLLEKMKEKIQGSIGGLMEKLSEIFK